ncbi:MAG: hypothetical protein KA072_01165 [Thermoanaerobaculaceae bacterium]|nr:hypothetical protein [Thermoanaerobaculaceae bacterium]MDI9622419.1 hypothetical protein [Acidobacteriota bacterium]NLH11174.1 hypothetical protein [Holophagae bacterium]HPW54320.1 hypothetical protein [Thermoanaerobaculaceae bacterium]
MSELLLVGGLTLLVVGAELLVRGAVRLAAAAGVSSLLIGLTVVAFGTSAPELAVSVGAGLGMAVLGARFVVDGAVAIVCLPIFFTGSTVSRAEGALLLAYYGLSLAYLLLGAVGHGGQPVLGAMVLYLVVPLTVIGLGLGTWASIRRQRTAT